MPSFGRGIGQPGCGESQTHVATADASSGYGPPLGTAQPQKPCGYSHVVPTRSPQCCPTGTLANVAGHALGFGGVGHCPYGFCTIHCPPVHCATVLHAMFGSLPHSQYMLGTLHAVPEAGGELGQ